MKFLVIFLGLFYSNAELSGFQDCHLPYKRNSAVLHSWHWIFYVVYETVSLQMKNCVVSWINCSNMKTFWIYLCYSCRRANCTECYQVFILTVTEMVVWVITPYKLLTLFQHFKGTKRFRWVLKLPEPICHPPDGGSTFLWNVQRNVMQTFVLGHIWAKRTSFNSVWQCHGSLLQ